MIGSKRERLRWLGPLLFLVVAGCAAHHAAVTPPEESLALAVLPRVGLGPRDVSVTARIDRDAENRKACLAFVDDNDLDTFLSCHDLDGASAPRFWQRLVEQVPAGAYTVELRVTRADGTVRRVRVDVCYAGQLKESCGLGESAAR